MPHAQVFQREVKRRGFLQHLYAIKVNGATVRALRLAKEASEAEAKAKLPEPSEAKPVRRRRAKDN